MHSFEARLSAALGETAGKIYLAAVSGGADSTAMLAGLAVLREKAAFSLHCVHVEHGIRPASENQGDAQAVETLCEKLNVPCRVISIPPGKIASYAAKGGPGIEGAARFFRHKALRAEARRVNADLILTAHTCDDLLETILMRVLRGSGPAGLSPMPRMRGCLLRPLLELTRKDVLEYLEKKDILYRTDSTNADIMYLRNRIRLKLIPVLDDFFPSWRNSLLALAETQALTADFLSSEVRKSLTWESDMREEAHHGSSPSLKL
ncbi:MAG: tRNA lysidine(34) synthetase TilS, partial [Treponema sp.]|nr:tRNA lysidine(34) synthetase TilS [Treponema sp.]